jgi:quinol monooxygenase YgiN
MNKRFKAVSFLLVSILAVGLGVVGSAIGGAPEELDKGTYALVATFTVKPGTADKFVAAMKTNVVESRKEPGVVDYRSYQSPENPLVFINFESYKDKAAFDAHLKTPHVVAIGKVFDEILAKAIEVKFLQPY